MRSLVGKKGQAKTPRGTDGWQKRRGSSSTEGLQNYTAPPKKRNPTGQEGGLEKRRRGRGSQNTQEKKEAASGKGTRRKIEGRSKSEVARKRIRQRPKGKSGTGQVGGKRERGKKEKKRTAEALTGRRGKETEMKKQRVVLSIEIRRNRVFSLGRAVQWHIQKKKGKKD